MDLIPKAQATKGKTDKSDFIKIPFSASKDSMQGVKKAIHNGRKILASHISDKGLVLRIYEKLPNSAGKGGKGLEYTTH